MLQWNGKMRLGGVELRAEVIFYSINPIRNMVMGQNYSIFTIL